MNLIFDMDGTLADTAQATIPAIAELCALEGLPVPSDQAIVAAIGTANPDFYYRLFPNHPREAVYAVGQRVEAAEERFVYMQGEAMLFPGVREMLDALLELGVAMHIASTGDVAHVEAVLVSAGIKNKFLSIHCNRPDKSDMIAGIIGDGDKLDWAMVGDRDKDIKGARDNGIAALGAGFGYCPKAEWPLYDAVFHAPHELVDWVRKRQSQ